MEMLKPSGEERYEGDVRDGLRHGLGKLLCGDGSLVYTGEWKAGKRDGHGVEYSR